MRGQLSAVRLREGGIQNVTQQPLAGTMSRFYVRYEEGRPAVDR